MLVKYLVYVTLGVATCAVALAVTAHLKEQTGLDLTFALAFAAGSLWSGIMNVHRLYKRPSNQWMLLPDETTEILARMPIPNR